MPEYVVRATLPKTLDAFTRAYLECAEWCGIDEDQQEAFELSVTPTWTEDSIKRAIEDCKDFQKANAADIDGESEQAGHDFWLTRNGHGAGFWDGDWPKDAGERMTANSEPYGTVNVWYDEDAMVLSLS